jgi:hypothetical protein
MANEKPQDVLKANAGAPEAMIPDLKKKEKERKKAGAAWSGARGAASEFSGATGGSGVGGAGGAIARAAASAAAEAGMAGAEGLEGEGLMAAISRFFSGASSFFSGLMATALGRAAVAAAVMLMVAAAGLIGYALLKGNPNQGLGNPDLGGISDSMRVRAGGDDRLGVASNGEIRFDPQSAAKPAVAAPTEPPKAADKDKAAADKTADANAQKPVPSGLLAHNLSGAQLSSSLGGNFGSKNIFSGNGNAPKFGGAGTGGLPPINGRKGNLTAMKASNLHATPSATNINKGSASRALGQLKLTKGLSNQGADATTAEGAAQASQDAFDQQQTTGGGLNTPGAPGGDSVVPPGSGAPPDTSMGGTPADPTGGATDPGLQGALAQISALANQAMQDMQMGEMEVLIGGILLGIGIALEWNVWTSAIGYILAAAGLAMIAMGMSNINKAKQEEAQAMSEGQTLASQIGNEQQGQAINYCTQQAVNSGTPVSGCTPPENITDATQEQTQDQTDIQRVKTIGQTQPSLGSGGTSQ